MAFNPEYGPNSIRQEQSVNEFVRKYGYIPDTEINTGVITVSGKGIANGTSRYLNDKAHFGQDTLLGATAPGQYGPPFTTTGGMAEAITYANYAGIFQLGRFSFGASPALTVPSFGSTYGSYIVRGGGLNSLFNSIGSALNGQDFITLQENPTPRDEYTFEDIGIQDNTSTGLNSIFISYGNMWMNRCDLYGRSQAKYLLDIEAGSCWVRDTLLDFVSTSGAYIYINTPNGGPFWFTNLYCGDGETAVVPAVYINNGSAGGYVFQGCNFTGSTIGIQVEGQTTDLLATMCEFAGSTGLILNATINTSSIIGNSFTATTPITYGSSFYPNKLRIQNNPGLNPFGLLATPFTTTVPSGGSAWMGPGAPSGTAAPVASTSYRVEVCDQIITSTGGTAVSITIKDAAGNTLLSAATTLTNYHLAAGWSIDFGAFTAAPTVTVAGL